MDELLNEDMSTAIDELAISVEDKELITALLFQERNNKDREWEDDAVKYIAGLLNRSLAE